MAGDIGIEESVVVLPPKGAEKALAPALEATAEPTGVLHHYGPRVLIGEIPELAPPVIAEAVPSALLSLEAEAMPAPAELDLDPIGKIGLEAFELRQSGSYLEAKEQRPLAGAPWNTEQGETPGCAAGAAPPPVQNLDVPMGGPPAPTSERLLGRVAVGIIVVSGPTPDLQFSQDEYVKIVAEVQNGLGWLGSQSIGGGVSWYYDLRQVSIPTPPGPSMNQQELNEHWLEVEELWRNPTMEALGHSGNWQGVLDYVEEIRTNLGTRWSYCGFFTKYPVFHFGYASVPRIVMQAPYDGWGPDNIDSVFTHETGHIFGAPDEYGGCNCGGAYGIFGRPNANCVNCGPGSECLMIQNSWAMCAWTPWHLSFYWPAGLKINENDSTPAAPAAVTFNNELYLAWTANDSSNSIYFSASSDGMTWPAGQRINQADSTPEPPAMASFGGKLYMFWKANDSSNSIYWSASSDGATWPAGQRINQQDATPAALAAATFDGKLYLFWTADDASHSIYYSASSDGATWPAGQRINQVDSTLASPAAVTFEGKPYLFWKANDSSNTIYCSASSDGVTWPAGQRINERDSTPAALAPVAGPNRITLAWTANDSSHRIYSSVFEP